MKRNVNYLLIFLFLILIFLRFYKFPDHIFSWDVFGYYLYLPAIFIYNDIKLLNHEWLNEIINKYETTVTLYQAYRVETGNWLIRYTMGNAILLSPFFFIAHLIAPLLNYQADGFSLPYRVITAAGGIAYACLGLFYLWKILNNFFNTKITSITLLVVFFGTNYAQLTVDGTLLTHNFLFTLYAILIYHTIAWHQKQTFKNTIMISLAIGLIIIVRPTETVCILIPLLWNIFNRSDITGKLSIIKNNLSQIGLGILIILICILPQMIYWKIITGNFIIDSYNYPGEGLDFHSPHLFDFLFSFRKGWFIYTPVMIFSVAGLYFIYRYNNKIFFPILIFLVLDIYILSSWTVWWYTGASYSQRAIVPAYTLLSIPMGYFIKELFTIPKNQKYAFYLIGGFFIMLNIFQWWQFDKGIISKERMTKEYYFAVFGKTSVNDEDKKLLLVDRSIESEEYFLNKNEYQSKIIFYDDFSGSIHEADTGDVFIMDENNPFSPGPNITFENLTGSDHAWLRIETSIFIPEDFEGDLPVLVATFHHKEKPYKYKGKSFAPNEIIYDNWNKISFDYITPEVRNKRDNLKVYVWHRAKSKIYIDYLKVEAYEKL
jgi:hypothetical protein